MRQHFCSVKAELFEDALPSEYISKCHFHIFLWTVKTEVFESDDACLDVYQYLCLYQYVLFTFSLLLKICNSVHSSHHSPANITENVKNEAGCDLDQAYSGD